MIRILEQKAALILIVMIALYVSMFTAFTFIKYDNFGYNALDLAIYQQVFWNSSHGNLFGMSIHPHLYLGDHFELFILLLLPFFLIWQSPLLLLFLQTVFIALATWPLFLIAKRELSKPWALGIVTLFLASPFIQNANMFEFHILPFAISLLLWGFYFYQTKRFWLFFLFAVLSLTVREDVSLVIFMFGILALLDRRGWRWVLVPIIFAASWFKLSTELIAYFNSEHLYKFQLYFTGTGEGALGIVQNIFIHPVDFLAKLLTFNNLLITLGLLLPLALLPLLKPRYLILGILVALQLFLTGFGSEVVLETHYTSLLMPILFITSVFAIQRITQNKDRIAWFLLRWKGIFLLTLAVSAIYSMLVLGPIAPSITFVFNQPSSDRVAYDEIVNDVPLDAPVAGSFALLPQLASRPELYSLHYAFLGRQQFSFQQYTLPDNVHTLAFDSRDALLYQLGRSIQSYKEQYSTGDDRLRSLIDDRNLKPALIRDAFALFRGNANNTITLYEALDSLPGQVETKLIHLGPLTLVGWEVGEVSEHTTNSYQMIDFYWSVQEPVADDYQLAVSFLNNNGVQIEQRLFPLAYGLLPTTEWQPGKVIRTTYAFRLPERDTTAHLRIAPVLIDGYRGLSGIRSAVPVFTSVKKTVEATIDL